MEGKGYLLLADGQLLEGKRFGAKKDVHAELVFTTGMTGYLETLTDPSYEGQIVVQTFPEIGNYGVIPQDFESPHPTLSGYVVRAWCEAPSNFRSQGNLDAYLRKEDIPGLCGVDTRFLTRRIRSTGVMNAALLSKKPEQTDAVLARLRALPFHPSVQDVSCNRKIEGKTRGKYHVVLWDFGAKDGIRRCLEERGCRVTSVSADATAAEILSLSPDGVMLSNGPGDPADNTEIIEQLSLLETKRIPTFGICLGHQLLALSQGAKTRKLKYGHRGANQPVRDLATGKSYMSSQNHGFAVDAETLPAHARLRFVNGNDGTCEGLDYKDMPAFSVQFHPEACAGPLDTRFLFDRFTAIMEQAKQEKAAHRTGGDQTCR